MPYKYFGRKTDFVGKTLWELLGNLKNFGIGRLITRGKLQKYPEPSYYRIVEVETLANPLNPSYDNVRKVNAYCEFTFRGKKCSELYSLYDLCERADFQLIPKDEEESFCKYEPKPVQQKIFPKTMAFPPLLREMIIREMIAKDGKAEEPKLEIAYNASFKHKLAEDGETPNVEVTPALGNPVSPSLYKNLKL